MCLPCIMPALSVLSRTAAWSSSNGATLVSRQVSCEVVEIHLDLDKKAEQVAAAALIPSRQEGPS
jgi:hypothetical protein